MKEIPQQVSESVRRRNPHLYGEVVNCEGWEKVGDGWVRAGEHPPKPPKRIRQSTKPLLNKLESEWLVVLNLRKGIEHLRCQSVRYKLGNGVWYKPDFTAVGKLGFNQFYAWEVKGPHAFRGGFENLKIAASLYPEITWVLCWKDDANQWQEQFMQP